MKKQKVLYPGSFNPWHIGHQEIYNRACILFGYENVTVVLAKNPKKDLDLKLLSVQFVELNIPFIIMDENKPLSSIGDIIVRGIRPGDFEYESNLAIWNNFLGCETIFLNPQPSLSHISSTAIRQMFELGESRNLDCFFPNKKAKYAWLECQ